VQAQSRKVWTGDYSRKGAEAQRLDGWVFLAKISRKGTVGKGAETPGCTRGGWTGDLFFSKRFHAKT